MITRVSEILRVDLKTFFQDYVDFISQYRQSLTDYYLKGTSYPKTAFDTLSDLKKRTQAIYSSITSFRSQLTQFSDFEVIDKFEMIVHTLEILENYSRWLRSSLFKGQFKSGTEINFILKQNQTLESFSEEIGFQDRDSASIDLALRNKIKETDYSLEGGGLTFTFTYIDSNEFSLSSIVDNLSGENVLGKDLKKKLTLSEEDLEVLSPQETFTQTCSILLGLIKRDNPEFPYQGYDKSSISNKNTLVSMIPSFIRQFYSTVQRDDSIFSFQISKVDYQKDSLFVEITFKSWLNNEIKQVVNGN